MNTSFLLMVLSASSLPLLAFLTLLLRRNMLQGKAKAFLLIVGSLLLGVTLFDTFTEHGETLTGKDIVIGIVTTLLTLFVLTKFSHGHHHSIQEGGAKGIVISEAFHSLLDGAVIGATYVVNPLLGYAATVGIVVHELPKIIGTLALLRSIGLSTKKTILYGIFAQIGSPAAAILLYLLGKEFDSDQFHSLEIASISSLTAIVLWIIYLEIRFHTKHKHTHTDH